MEAIEVGEIFSLTDENNEEQEVEVLGAMDVEGAEYIAVAFVEDIQTETEEDIDIFFLKIIIVRQKREMHICPLFLYG